MKKIAITFWLWNLIGFSNGQSWLQVGDFNDSPRVLFSDTIGGDLYVGGNFKWTGLDTVNGICFWDGVQIHKMTSGICGYYPGGNVCNPILMITRFRDKIYAGAAMDWAGGVPANGIAAWDGEAWSVVGDNSLLTHTNSRSWVLGTSVYDDKLYAAGFFRTAGGDTCNSVAVWDGAQWKGLAFPPRPPNNGIPFNNSIRYFKGELYVGGNTENIIDGNFNMDIARYDGTTWKQLEGGLYGGFAEISDMEVYKDELYVCGYFRKVDGNVGNKIMRWDGEQWKEVGGGLCSPSHIPTDMMVHDGKLYIVGIFDCVDNGLPVSNIAVWDGERWCSLGNSTFNNKLSCIAAYKGEIYVGGGFTEVDGQPCRKFAKWVGDHATDTCSAPVSAAPEPMGEGFGLWPNPATDLLRLKAPSPIEAVWVFDVTGKAVSAFSQPPYSATEEAISIQIGSLPPGLYYVTLQSAGRTYSGKFVKM